MYSEELEKLIDFAIIDGEVTQKERTVLQRKAEYLGIDSDEFELILNARLYDAKSRLSDNSKPKKCPNCGDTVNGLSKVCPSCDFVAVTYASSDLDERLDVIHEGIVKLKTYPPNGYLKIMKSLLLTSLSYGLYILYKKFYKKETLFSNVKAKEYRLLQDSLEANIKSLKLKYGENAQVKKVIEEFNLEFALSKKEQKKRKIYMTALSIILTISFISVVYWVGDSDGLYIDSAKEDISHHNFDSARENISNIQNKAVKDSMTLILEDEITYHSIDSIVKINEFVLAISKAVTIDNDSIRNIAISKIVFAEIDIAFKNKEYDKALKLCEKISIIEDKTKMIERIKETQRLTNQFN